MVASEHTHLTTHKRPAARIIAFLAQHSHKSIYFVCKYGFLRINNYLLAGCDERGASSCERPLSLARAIHQ